MTALEKTNRWDLYNPDWKTVFDACQKADDLDGMKEAWLTQFENAPEYAACILKSLKDRAIAENLCWVEIDVSKSQTAQDVNDVYASTSNFLDTQRREIHKSLPLDKTSGLFSKDSSQSVRLEYRSSDCTVHTIATGQQQGDELNVCFEYLNHPGTRSIYNAIEDVATVFYTQQLKENHPDPSKINWLFMLAHPKRPLEKFFNLSV